MGLTVFKTAGGSLGAVPGGFDSHTPLPFFALAEALFPLERGMELSSASFLGLRSHASSLPTALALLHLPELRKAELMVRTLEEVNVERIRSLIAGGW